MNCEQLLTARHQVASECGARSLVMMASNSAVNMVESAPPLERMRLCPASLPRARIFGIRLARSAETPQPFRSTRSIFGKVLGATPVKGVAMSSESVLPNECTLEPDGGAPHAFARTAERLEQRRVHAQTIDVELCVLLIDDDASGYASRTTSSGDLSFESPRIPTGVRGRRGSTPRT